MLEEICTVESAEPLENWTAKHTSKENDSFAIDIEVSEQAITFYLAGKLTFRDCRIFEKASENLDLQQREFILDFRKLDFIDSAGIGMLLLLQEKYKSIYIRGAQGEPKKFIELAQITPADHFI